MPLTSQTDEALGRCGIKRNEKNEQQPQREGWEGRIGPFGCSPRSADKAEAEGSQSAISKSRFVDPHESFSSPLTSLAAAASGT